MKRAFAKYGAVGVAALIILSSGIALVLVRPAQAQGGGQDLTGIVSGPVELTAAPGQRLQSNLYMTARGTGTRSAHTTFEVLVDILSPLGPQTVQCRFTVQHPMEVNGRTSRLSLVETSDNMDLYVDGVLTQTNMLNGLPPGEPWIGFVVNSETTVLSRGLDLLGGTVQAVGPDGHTIVALKHHEPVGNVTLYK